MKPVLKPSGLVALLLLISPSISPAFWGPKNFDECILQNMKGVTSDQAAGMIYESCRQKFPDTKEHYPFEINEKGQRVCRVYWVGKTFAKDGKANRKGFATIDIEHEGDQILYVARIPEGMNKNLKNSSEGYKNQFIELLTRHMPAIQVACNL